MVDKKELAQILTNHAVGQSKTSYSESDITDGMLKHYNTEMDKFMKKYPDFDVYLDDYSGTEDDLFIDILINTAKKGGFNLVEGLGEEEGDPTTLEEDFQDDLTMKWLSGDKAALSKFVADNIDKMGDPHINKMAKEYANDDNKMYDFIEMILTKLGKLDEGEEEMVETKKKEGDKWNVYSKDGKKLLGSHDSEGDADAQLAAIEISKHEAKTITNEDLSNIYEMIFVECPESMAAFEEFIGNHLDLVRSTNDTMIIKEGINILEPMKEFFNENEGIGSKLKGAIGKTKGKIDKSLGKIFNSGEEEGDGEEVNEDVDQRIVDFLKENPEPTDDQVHALADELGIETDELEAEFYKIAGAAVNEKAVSVAQQQLFGSALSVKRGEQKLSDLPADVQDEVKGIVDSMTEEEIKKMASTKQTGLPDKVKENKNGDKVGDTPNDQDGSTSDDGDGENTNTPAPEDGSKLGTQDDPDLGDGQPIKVDGNTVTIKEGDEIETEMLKGSVTKVGEEGIGMCYDDDCCDAVECDDEGYGIMSPETLMEAKSLKINGKMIKEAKLEDQILLFVGQSDTGVSKEAIDGQFPHSSDAEISAAMDKIKDKVKIDGDNVSLNEAKLEDDEHDQEGSTADNDAENTDTPPADGTGAEKGALELEKGDKIKIGDVEGTMTKATDSGIEVKTGSGETENIAMSGLNVNEGCEVNGKSVVIKEGKIYEADDNNDEEEIVNEDKFSIVLVSKDHGDGTIDGSWVQDVVGADLEDAIQRAKDTEAANGNKQDYAVVKQLAGGSPNYDTKTSLKRLDTKRIGENRTKPVDKNNVFDVAGEVYDTIELPKGYKESDFKNLMTDKKSVKDALGKLGYDDDDKSVELVTKELMDNIDETCTEKIVDIEEALVKSAKNLVVGKKYKTPSGLGGVFTIEYMGKEGDKHQFKNVTNKDFEGAIYSYTDDEISKVIHENEMNEDHLEGRDAQMEYIIQNSEDFDTADDFINMTDDEVQEKYLEIEALSDTSEADNPYMVGKHELKDGDTYKTKDGTDVIFMGYDDATEAEGKNYLFDDGTGTQAYTKEEAESLLEAELKQPVKSATFKKWERELRKQLGEIFGREAIKDILITPNITKGNQVIKIKFDPRTEGADDDEIKDWLKELHKHFFRNKPRGMKWDEKEKSWSITESTEIMEADMGDEEGDAPTVNKDEEGKIEKLPMFEDFKGGSTMRKNVTKANLDEGDKLPSFNMFMESRKEK